MLIETFLSEREGAMEGGGGGEKVLPIERSPQARSSIHS